MIKHLRPSGTLLIANSLQILILLLADKKSLMKWQEDLQVVVEVEEGDIEGEDMKAEGKDERETFKNGEGPL